MLFRYISHTTMSIKTSTHRLLWVDYYKLIDLYAVPKDWELDKIDIKNLSSLLRWGFARKYFLSQGVVDTAVPEEIRFEDEFEQFFDCE